MIDDQFLNGGNRIFHGPSGGECQVDHVGGDGRDISMRGSALLEHSQEYGFKGVLAFTLTVRISFRAPESFKDLDDGLNLLNRLARARAGQPVFEFLP